MKLPTVPILACLFMALYSSPSIAEDRVPWELRLRYIEATTIDSNEPGSENELFGYVSVAMIGDSVQIPSNNDDVILWKQSDDDLLHIGEGKRQAIGASKVYMLSDADVQKGFMYVTAGLWEDDNISDDYLGTSFKVIQISDIKDDEVVLDGFKNDGDTAKMVFTFKKKSTSAYTVTPDEPSQVEFVAMNGEVPEATVYRYKTYTQNHNFDKLVTQIPNISTVLEVELAKDKAGNREVLIDLYGSHVAASTNGKIDANTSTHRGYFVEYVTVKISAPGLNLIDNQPKSFSLEGSETNRTDFTFSSDVGFDGGSFGAGLGISKAVSATYRDYVPLNSGTNPVTHKYKLAFTEEGGRFEKPTDLATDLDTALSALPVRSTHNFPIASWALFRVPDNAIGKTVKLKVDYTIGLMSVNMNTQLTDWASADRISLSKSVTFPVKLSILE